MSVLLLNEEEKNDIRGLYESHGIFLNEESIWGVLAKKAISWAGKNEDDIIKLFKTTEVALAKSIDDIVSLAAKSKNLAQLDDLQAKLMHFYNPSGGQVEAAKQNVVKFLNAYSKSKGKANWKVIRDEVSGASPQQRPQPKPSSQGQNPNDDYVQFSTNPIGAISGNKFSGNRVSNRTLESYLNKIDSSVIKNWGGGLGNYNKLIARAIETGDYQYISSKGFEYLGITDFRKFLKNNIAKVNEVIPETGRWSVTFK
jgi:hypothetical protein